MRRAAIVVLVLVAACSSGGSETTGTTTTSNAPQKVTVRLAVQLSGAGSCVGSSPISGNGSRVTAKDPAGTVIGTATFALTPKAEVCDWTATLELPDVEFVTLEGDKGKLATLSRSDIADGKVTLVASVTGQITVD